jgi:7-cyano-7-deazaguanine synthase
MTSSPKSIVLLSGGLDSALAFVHAKKTSAVQFALTFDYGQKANNKEIKSAQKICEHYKVEHKTISLPIFPIFTKLTNHPFFSQSIDCPSVNSDQLDDKTVTLKSAETVWVPNRNGIFLNVAAGLAESLKIAALYVGFNAEEAATFPDNSKDYLKSINQSLSFSTLNQVKVLSPTVDMVKKEIFKELMTHHFPISYLWSCYHPHEKMCGRCESCQRFKRAAAQNNWSEKIETLFQL